MSKSFKILIVDDRRVDRRLLRKMLESRGHEVQEAADGQEGLEMLRLHKPDLIISDALMPGMDGFRFLRNIKKDEDLKAIPFIFHSSVFTGSIDEKLAFSLGARAFIEKPAPPDEFIEKVTAIIQQIETKEQPVPVELIEDEKEYLRNYSDVVATKLEEKVEELENINKKLQIEIAERKQAEEELKKHREHLEELVKERTGELEEKTIELEQANIRLQEVDRLKSMFIASMSHELRTPLNSIIGFTGIILMGLSGELTDEQKKQLTMVRSSARHLLSLINDIIDVSKIEEGKVDLSIEEFDLSALLREMKDSFMVAINEKDLDISLKVPEGLMIRSDKRRVRQIIVNLVGNAVKFTEEGEIAIRSARKDKIIEVTVRDTGPGITKDHLDMLFKAFSRVPTEGTIKEGTGLGLYLSKKIADLLGGEISAESEFGRGTEFTFTMPVKYEEVEG